MLFRDQEREAWGLMADMAAILSIVATFVMGVGDSFPEIMLLCIKLTYTHTHRYVHTGALNFRA